MINKHSSGAQLISDGFSAAEPLTSGDGTPPGFFNNDTVSECGEFDTQSTTLKALAPLEGAQGGVDKPSETPTSDTLRELLPELPPLVGMTRGGRPSVLTAHVKEQLFLLLSLGLSRRQAASYLDIDHSTIAHACERDPDFARGLGRAEDLRVAGALLHVVAQARRNWRAAAWLVEHAPKIKHKPTAEDREQKHRQRLEQIRRNAEATRLEDEMYEERTIARKQREIDRNHAAYLADRELRKKEIAESKARRAARQAAGE